MADEKDNKKSPPRAPQPPSNLPVVNQLSEGNKVAVAQEKGINDLNAVMTNLFDATVQGTQVMIDHLGKILNIQESQFALQQEIQREAYERWLESQRAKDDKGATPPTDAEGNPQDPSNLPLGFITGLAIALGALAAEISGLDAAIRAAQLPSIFKSFKTGIATFADTLKNIDFKGFRTQILRAFGIGEDGKKIVVQGYQGLFRRPLLGSVLDAINGVLDRFDNIVKVLFGDVATSITEKANTFKTNFIDDATKLFTNMRNVFRDFVFGAEVAEDFKLQGSTLFTFVGNKIKAIRDAIVNAVNVFTTDGQLFKDIDGLFNNLPRLQNLMPKGTDDVINGVKSFLGTVEDGTGILGFFGKVFDFLKPLMKPFEFVLKTVMRPFTQIVFTLIDFVTGFYEGFTQTEGGLLDKIAGGFEGGVLGIIKGITEAIDLIFIELPAWIAKKLGFEGLASSLQEFSITELVDPVWDAIKKFFKTLFSGDIMGAGAMVVGGTMDFVKSIIRSILPENKEFKFTDKSTWAGGLIPQEIYDWVGEDTKKVEAQVEPKDTGKGAGGAAGGKAIDQVKMVPLPGSMSPMTDNSQVAVTTINRAGDKQVTYVQKSWQQPMPLKPSSAGMDY